MERTINTVETRPVEKLRDTPYLEMSSAEILKFQREDPAAYETMVTAMDTPPVVVPEGEIPAPVPATRKIYRNGVEVDTATAVRFVNGIPQ